MNQAANNDLGSRTKADLEVPLLRNDRAHQARRAHIADDLAVLTNEVAEARPRNASPLPDLIRRA